MNYFTYNRNSSAETLRRETRSETQANQELAWRSGITDEQRAAAEEILADRTHLELVE